MLNNSQPYEYEPGVYVHNFTAGPIGEYIAYATVQFASLTYLDAGFFTVRWNNFENYTDMQNRVDNLIASGHLGRQNQTRMIVYHLKEQDLVLSDISEDLQGDDDSNILRDAALQGIFQAIFSLLLVVIVIVVGTVLWGQRKTKKLIREISPGEVAEKVVFAENAEKEKTGKPKEPVMPKNK